MKVKNIHIAAGILTVATAVLSVIIIYKDISAVPEFNKFFVKADGGISSCSSI